MKRVAFLNGEPGFGNDAEEELSKLFISQGIEVKLVDNLFERPAKLRDILDYDTLVFGTSGVRPEEVMCLVYDFRSFVKASGYKPKNVIFTMDETQFVHLTNEFPSTCFYRLDYIDYSLIPLKYLNGTN